jgi:hypothetical protein
MGKLEGRNNLEERRIGGRIILEWIISNRVEGRGLDFSRLVFDRLWALVFMCFIKCVDFPRRNIVALWEDTNF